MRLIFQFIICTVFLFSNPAIAQEANTPPVEKKQVDISVITTDLQKIEKGLEKQTPQKNDSVKLIKQLSVYYSELQDKKTYESNNLSTLQKKLTALGEIVDGTQEAKEIAKQRTVFEKEIEQVKAQISKTDLALTQIDTLNQKIAALRTQGLLDSLMVKRNSILNIQEFGYTIFNFGQFLYHLLKYPVVWYNDQTPQVQHDSLIRLTSLLFWAIGALVLAIIVNIFVRKKLGYDMPITNPNYSQKVKAGIFMICARAVIPAAIPVAFLVWRSQNPDFLIGQFGTLIDILAHYLIYLFLFTGLASVLFTPKKPQWRLIEVNNERALRISKNLIFSICILAFFSFLHVTAQRFEIGEDTIYAIKMFNNFIKGICIILLSHSLLYNSASLTDEELNSDETEIQGLSLSSKLSLLIALAASVILVYSMLGYVKLAEFIYNRFIISVCFIGLAYIFQKFIFVLFHQLMSHKFWNKNLRLTKQKITKFEYLFNFLTIPVVAGFTILCILGVWGVPIDIMIQNIKKFLIGFDIGGMHVSLSSIFLGIVAFFITRMVFKFIKNSLSDGKLSQVFDIEIGVRTSIAALIGFTGTILAFIVGLSVMGGSLKGLALAAGALSLGAGLGLQNVVNNFVSGIILLFERPFKIGDWILVDQYEGIVKQINMRSTQIETFNKSNVIIPNATLLSNSLINMTYKNKQSRVDLFVGVDYNSDIDLVKQTLLDCAKETKGVLQVPNPYVAFMELADNSLNFRLSFYISDVNNRLSTQTAAYSLIVKRFRENNIEIPFPQRVLHIQKEGEITQTDIVSD